MVYPWVDLQPDRRIKSVYSGEEFDPLKLIELDAEIDRAGDEQLEGLRATESAADPAVLEIQEAILEASLPYNCEHVVPQSWFDKRGAHVRRHAPPVPPASRGATASAAIAVLRLPLGGRGGGPQRLRPPHANQFQPTAGLGARGEGHAVLLVFATRAWSAAGLRPIPRTASRCCWAGTRRTPSASTSGTAIRRSSTFRGTATP